MNKTITIDGVTLEYVESENNLHIIDSYKVSNDNLKWSFVNMFYQVLTPKLNRHRTVKSLVNEWKVHNAFYNRGWSVNRTKDVDFEYNQNWFMTLLYAIASVIFKE